MERDEDVTPPKDGGERATGWETTRGAESEDAPWDSFRVLVRLRPGDKSDETKRCVKVEGQHGVQINTGRGNQTQVLEFDAVLDEDASQRDVYEAIAKPLARRVLDGFHGCVATYGAPATGKTHSLYGTGLGGGRQRGLLSRAAEDIFQGIQKSSVGCTHRVVVSFIQLWNERLYDLLDHQHTDRIRIHETDEAVSLEGLVETEVTSVEGLLKAFRKGMTNRSAGISKGEIGSRSHTIFYITVVQTVVHTQQQPQEATIITGRLTLVDLAGSGRVVRRGALGDSERGRRLFPTSGEDDINDAKNVNRSLTLLANVIFALTTPGCQHIPYRESKLTRILRDCLGGSCCTALLVTLSAGAQAAHEAHGALQLAARARTIACRPIRNISVRASEAADKSDAEGTSAIEQGLKRLSPAGQHSTSFPPIHPAPSPRPFDRTRSAQPPSLLPDDSGKELREQRVTLPQLSERSPKSPKPTASGAEGRGGGLPTGGRPPLGPAADASEGGREQRPPAKLERLVAAEVEGAQLPSQTTLASGPCSSCRRERRIREEYDKFVVQARRERDALQRRVAELEQELRSRDVAPGRGDSSRGGGGGGGGGGDAKVELGAEDDVPRRSWLTGDGDCAQVFSVAEERGAQTNGRGAEERGPKAALIAPERGDDDAQARRGSSVERHQGCEEKAQAAEKAMAAAQKERDSLLVEVEELTSQLQRERDVDPGPAAAAAAGGGGGGGRLERERLSAELEELRAQLGKARERERRKLATLEGEKDRLLQELQDSRSEAGQLRGQTRQQQVDAAREKEILLAEIEKLNGRLQRLGAEAALLRGTVERMERAPNSHPFKQPFLGPETQLGQRDGSYMEEGDYLEELSRAREALRQTRRERNLLLDVMSIMYTRRWFAPEATVHVRRTLQRCGVHSAQHD
ncbi:kinesin-like protein Klp68D isoform X2 [Lethenteron reissneri]|nr:kinesin-like protein Klp68D isoform X2 [Lethenteron reissneri]